MSAGSDMARPRRRRCGTSLTRAAAATTRPAKTPSNSACARICGPACGTVTASTPARVVCSTTGTHTRTAPSRSLVTGRPVVNAGPASVPATSCSAPPAASGTSTWHAKSARYTTGSRAGTGSHAAASTRCRSAPASRHKTRSASW
ncbi:MAG TPA: hypothetical protein VGJ50_14675 [Streptosporangiaceae bacterium]